MVFFLIAVWVALPALAETGNNPSGPRPAAPLTTQAPPSTNSPSAPPTSNAQPSGDRAQDSGKASALAIAAAAMAGVSCMMLLEQAQRAEEAGDQDRADMLRAQAMQQCAQAAKNADSGDKNKKGQQANQSAPPSSANAQLNGNPQQQPDSGSGDQAPTATEDKPYEKSEFDPKIALNDSGSKVAPPAPIAEVTGQAIGPTALSSIPKDQLVYAENAQGTAKGGGSLEGANGSGRFISGAGGVSVASNPGAGQIQTPAARPLADTPNGIKKTSEEQAGAEGGSGGGSAGGGGGDNPFQAMMNQLLGGGGGAGEGGGNMASQEILAFADPGGGTGPNIFEYASYRYRKAVHEEGRVHLKVRTLAKTP